MAMMAEISGRIELQPIVAELESCLRDIQSFDPLRLLQRSADCSQYRSFKAIVFASKPLVHLTLAVGDDRSKPSRKIVGRLFAQAGKGRLGSKEYLAFAWEQMKVRTGLHTFANLDRI